MGSYQAFMALGNKNMGKPFHKQAAVNFFEAALDLADQLDETLKCAAACQMLGITERLRGRFANAEHWFNQGLVYAASDIELRARIMRDKAMSLMAESVSIQMDSDEREAALANARDLLGRAYPIQKGIATPEGVLEAAITRSFQGRLEYLAGNFGGARHIYEFGYGPIKEGGNDTYHLNHLMWWLLVAHKEDLRWMTQRIRSLVAKTGDSRRSYQLPFAYLSNRWLWLTKR